jgi:iron complex outermembrane receptor protein
MMNPSPLHSSIKKVMLMDSRLRLSAAIAAILGASAARLTLAATASPDNSTDEIQEITVTAQRRSENMQDVPITIQAMTQETLAQLNVTTFDDFIKFLPNVTESSTGPGQGNIYMRGLSIGNSGVQNAATLGQIPNVAVYLDDQSAALPGRNLDVYAADLERIEVLEGPQGTLFGSGAQAGVLRYITNKPKLDVTEGDVNAGYSYTAHGDPNSNVDAMLNVPLIADTLAARLVIYDDNRGGYINNVPGTFVRSGTDEGFAKYNNGVVPANSVVINNNNIVGSAINPVTYQGMRLSLLAKINEDWNVLLTQAYQNMTAQGVFYEMPYASNGTTFSANGTPIGSQPLPRLSVNLFNPSYDKDRFENTAVTVNGAVGDMKLVYSGAYLVRNVDQAQDYTNYARGVFGYYYQCAGYSGTSTAAGKCYSPSATWQEKEKNTHQSHEIRLSTPDAWRIRGVAGLYYEQYVTYDDTEWLYKTVPTCSATIDVNCFNNIQPAANAYSSNRSVRNDSTAYLSDEQKTIDQKAAFGSVDFELIPRTLTATLGTRYYRFNEQEQGSSISSFYCKAFVPTTYFGPCLAPATSNVSLQNPNHSEYSGFRSRANLSWKVTSDNLVYYTWSQGFRPGGFNVGVPGHLPLNGVDQYYSPATYAPDLLTNNELGFKTLLLSRRLQLNGAIYQEDWKNTQVGLFDPQAGLGNLVIATNGGTYQVRGGEVQLVAKIFEGLTVQGSSSYNHSKQTNSPYLINNNPLSPGFGTPITSVANPFGAVGSPLANSPELQWNLRVRDEIPFSGYTGFWQIAAAHTASSLSATGNVQSFVQPGFTTYDASAGVAKDKWRLEVFGQNLTSVNASATTNASQFVEAETVIRPRVVGLKIGYKF